MKNKSRIWTFQTVMIGLLLILSCNCENKKSIIAEPETSSFTDSRDSKVYITVKIGDQWIMAENLAYKPDKGRYWAYENDTNNVAIYGYLYDWETAKNVALEGWHLPTKKEWITMRKSLGGKLELWYYMDIVYTQLVVDGGSGFNALFGGIRSCDGKFMYLDKQVSFWSSTGTNDVITIYGLKSNKDSIPHGLTSSRAGYAYRNDYNEGCSGYSVRLFKN